MPAARPRASFEPIPPDFDVRTFVETADNFQYVDRISHEMILKNGIDQFEKLVLLHVIIGGKPLVIDGFEEVLDPWTFTPSWLRDNHGEKVENARNLTTKENLPLTVKHYLKHMGKLTEQFFTDPERYRNKTCQRIYLKDIDCPQVWQDKLKDHIPAGLFYLNESTGEFGGPGALDEHGGRKGRGIARAGDLMSSLPTGMRAENLMCYIGHEGTYTPSHREMCASLGQNIMVNASGAISQDGKPERPGSSIWFMTETKDRHLVSEYWLSVLGHDIEVENHFAQLAAWKKAPFRTYVVEQRLGDFILIPPLAPHQVWNRGTRTMKIAWNRTTVETLELALSEALPNSRVVCRDEQYKNKAIVYYTLQKYSVLINSARAQVERGGEVADTIQRSVKIRQVQRDFKRLFELYKSILLSEMFATDTYEKPEFLPYDSNVTCAYCRCNIFNRFLSCKTCKNMFSKEVEEPYDICMDCYCMGRSCGCQSGYTWVEQWKWKDLIHKYEEWRAQIIDIDGQVTANMPLPLKEERRYLGKKTLAQVCQEQLRIRPFIDINNPQPEEESEDDEPVVDEWGNVKKVAKKKSKQWLAKHKSCHFCLKRHPKWKMAFCSNCDLSYCYGTLFRAHDLMPLRVMEESSWKCPHCRRVCNTGACRRDARQIPYEPKGTLLGHDTKKVADVRSIECLVDFSVSNLNFLREEEGMGQSAMHRRLLQAEMDKQADPSLDARFIDEHAFDRDGIAYSPVEDAEGIVDEYGNIQHHENDGMSSFYADPDANGEIPRLGRKRALDDDEFMSKRKKKAKKAKKQNEEALPKNVSSKEYQKEMQKRLLEEAKRDDRLILVAARMKNKSKIVKLSLPTGLLDTIRNRPAPERSQVSRQTPVEDIEEATAPGSILQSDILSKKAHTPGNFIEKEKAAKTFRYRVEADEAYNSRKRNTGSGGPAKSGRSGRPPRQSTRFEELTLDSDEDFENDEVEYTGRPRARVSNWLARKNEGEEDLPTELPPNFRDGDLRSQQERERNREYSQKRRQTMPAKSQASIQSVGRPPNQPHRDSISATSELGVPSDDEHPRESYYRNTESLRGNSAASGDEDEDAVPEEYLRKVVEVAHKASLGAVLGAKKKLQKGGDKSLEKHAAVQAAEANIRAKLPLFNAEQEAHRQASSQPSLEPTHTPLSRREDTNLVDDFLDNLSADDNSQGDEPNEPLAPTVPRPAANSILGRPGMEGRKIKIVGASAKRDLPAKSTPPIPNGFTAVNRRPQAVDLPGSDSEDNIPASKPELKRPVGRPAMVPTRGTAKRGRGRPRKNA